MNAKEVNYNWRNDSKMGQLLILVLITGAGGFAPILGGILFFIWRALTKLPFKIFGLFKPKKWYVIFLYGIPLGILLKLFFKAIVMPLIGAQPQNITFQYLQGDLKAAIILALFVIISAGLCEEIIFRGFLFNRLKLFLGKSTKAKYIIVLISSLIFGLPHLYQGLHGAIHATIVGIILGALYFKNNENLWLLVVTHAVYDLFSIFLIYNDLESEVATFFF